MSTVRTRPVPPGVTAAELDDALEALTAEPGPDKDALDPNGILSPGKSGIWPRGMREER